MFKMTLDEFFKASGVTEEEWESSGANWGDLSAIARDHDRRRPTLLHTADAYARDLQLMEGVHSVRSRVKDTTHLLAKIVRKMVENPEKYKGIGVDDYDTVITDLIGLRALHLFKNECIQIDAKIQDHFNVVEGPVANIRTGDSDHLYLSSGFTVNPRDSGYRSIHYVVVDRTLKREKFAEIQVRTIFEEGWSEIDHKVRYPNFSDDETLKEFLGVFNRIAGAADEMGSFVRSLSLAVPKVIEPVKEAVEKSNTEFPSALLMDDGVLSHIDALSHKNWMVISTATAQALADQAKSKKSLEPTPDTFFVVAPEDSTKGDYVSFTVIDRGLKSPARISRTALAVLRKGRVGDSDLEVFDKNKQQIRDAAYKFRQMNPGVSVIALGSNHFVPRKRA